MKSAAAIRRRLLKLNYPTRTLSLSTSPVVETEIPALAKEEIAAVELVAPPIVEVEEAQLVEAVAPGGSGEGE